MTYTIINARYANEDNTAIVITTVEAGDIALSEKDTPDIWSQVIGLEIKPYGEVP